jgi:transcription-repair coupling factor (superfamily II helicase)
VPHRGVPAARLGADERGRAVRRSFARRRVDRDLNRLRALLAGSPATVILCDNEGQRERLEELLEEGAAPAGATLAIGALDGGFVMPSLAVLTDHEIFRRARRLRRPRAYRQAAPSAATGALAEATTSCTSSTGSGSIAASRRSRRRGDLEVAIVEYEGGDRLNVPLYRLDQLERYRAARRGRRRAAARLHRWAARVGQQSGEDPQAIKQMAAELLDLYARRTVQRGLAFPPDSRWQRELESSFLYEDTPDQRKATEEVKADMERPRRWTGSWWATWATARPRSRCARRSRRCRAGSRSPVLVPTTILAEQHGRTFSSGWPISRRVEVLSRFRTAKEQKAALGALARADRHRDRNPSAAVEGRRFQGPGTAGGGRGAPVRGQAQGAPQGAPALGGRAHAHRHADSSNAPPLARRAPRPHADRDPAARRSPILTFVEPWDDALLEEAFARETDRGGQVFMVHNGSRPSTPSPPRCGPLAPRARVGVAHGQMAARSSRRHASGSWAARWRFSSPP